MPSCCCPMSRRSGASPSASLPSRAPVFDAQPYHRPLRRSCDSPAAAPNPAAARSRCVEPLPWARRLGRSGAGHRVLLLSPMK